MFIHLICLVHIKLLKIENCKSIFLHSNLCPRPCPKVHSALNNVEVRTEGVPKKKGNFAQRSAILIYLAISLGFHSVVHLKKQDRE